MSESENSGQVSVAGDAASAPRLQVNVRLQPTDESAQPIFSNFAMAQGASGTVFIDFGFLEPHALPALAHLAQTGGKMPENINGRLACRVALGFEAAAQLALQLNQVLKSATAAAAAAAQQAPVARAAAAK